MKAGIALDPWLVKSTTSRSSVVTANTGTSGIISTSLVSYMKTSAIKHSHLHLIPFHFYNFLPCFGLPGGQGQGRLRAGQDGVRLLGGGDGLKLPGGRGLGPAGGGEAGKRLFTVRTFIAFVANAEVAIAAAAAAVTMVTGAAGAGVRNKLERDRKWVNYSLVRKVVPLLGSELCVSEPRLLEMLFLQNKSPQLLGLLWGSLPRSLRH